MELNNQPIVSIIIPTYNRTDFLKLTLQSVLNQTIQDFEIIVVDDGTPDDENMFLCQTFEKVKYIKIENSGGPAKPRNVGIREAKGKYIAFVDDDDIWLPIKLEKQISVLENNPDFGLVHCCCQVVDENGIEKNEIIGRPGTLDVKHGDVSMRMMGNWTLMMPTPLIRREVVFKVGFFNERMIAAGEDVEYWNRASFFTKFYYIDLPLTRYRIHSLNNSKINKKEYLKLNIYNKEFLTEYRNKGIVSKSDYPKYIQKLVYNQIKMFKMNYLKSLIILNKLDPFWFLNRKNLKLFIFIGIGV